MTTNDATPRQDGATVSDTARQLGISERTVQRRINKGEYRTVERDGKRLVVLPDATVSDKKATMSDSVRQPDAALIDHLQRENDYLKGQIDAWRLQAEAANRTASETAAALRKALEALPKELPPAATETPQISASDSGAKNTDQEPLAPQMQVQNDTQTTNASLNLEQPGTPKRESVSDSDSVAKTISTTNASRKRAGIFARIFGRKV